VTVKIIMTPPVVMAIIYERILYRIALTVIMVKSKEKLNEEKSVDVVIYFCRGSHLHWSPPLFSVIKSMRMTMTMTMTVTVNMTVTVTQHSDSDNNTVAVKVTVTVKVAVTVTMTVK
jgi:hypothetical protein